MRKYAGLIQRGHNFHVRVGLPHKYWLLAKCTEIGYPLHTSSMELAVRRWRYELYHIQKFINVFEEVCMKLNDNKVIFSSTDVDKFLLFELERKQFKIEENTDDIIDGKVGISDIELFKENDSQDNPDKVKQLMQQLIFEYMEDVVSHQKANLTLRKIYQKLKDKEIELGIGETDDGYDWFNSFSHHLTTLEKYLRKSITSLQNDETYSPRSPKIVSLLRTYDEKKSKERLSSETTHTSWEKLYKRFFRTKQNLKGIREYRELENKHSLQVCFTLIGKEYLEDVTKQDCRKLCDSIYRVPKGWSGTLKEGETLGNLLNSGRTPISKTTVKGHLLTFKEFMRYCSKEDIIPNNFNECIETPSKLEKMERNPFTPNELKKIFNPETYPSCKERKNQARFWVPLVALFQGCRLNEICQLDVTDITVVKGIECISINDKGKDKSVKNKSSNRLIPIHPMLKELGFFDYAIYQARNNNQKVFPDLKYSVKQKYGVSIQRWFARYLDSIGIKGKDKVFHSFRHTFETCCIEKMLHTEHQNRLCGWTNKGVGQSVYGKHLTIPTLYEELSKVQYPSIKKELQVLKEKYAETYVMKFFNK